MASKRSRLPAPREYWPVFLLLLFQTAAIFFLLSGRDFAMVDDAYISFRYAARWALGYGLTFNAGTPVEGFSNPLWTLTLGALDRVGPPPDKTAPALSWMTVAALMLFAGMLARRRGLSRAASWFLWGGLALDAGLLVWAGSGLETALATCLVAAWLVRAASLEEKFLHGMVLGLLGAALALSRPEGLLWALWGLIWLTWGAWKGRRVLLGWAVGMIPFLGYLLFRFLFYGRLVPNTFFAKMEATTLGWDHTLSVMGRWALAHGAFLVLAGLLWSARRPAARHPRPGPPRWSLLLWGWFALQCLFWIAAGGDWMGHSRYLVPMLPLFYLGLAEAWDQRPRGWDSRRVSIAVILVLALHGVLTWRTRDTIPEYTRVGRELGTWLAAAASPGDTLAVTAAGAIPYYSGLYTVDVLGINDAEVVHRAPRHTGAWAPGHHRYDIDALIDVRPTWIVWDYGVELNRYRIRKYRRWGGDRGKLDYRSALFAHPGFKTGYAVDPNAPEGTRGAYTVFRRRER